MNQDLPMLSVYVSLLCFGLVAWSIPSIMAALVGDHAGPERTAAMFGFVTFLFGVGQIIGPAGAGFLAEQSGTFAMSFVFAAILAAAAIVLSLLLPGEREDLVEDRTGRAGPGGEKPGQKIIV